MARDLALTLAGGGNRALVQIGTAAPVVAAARAPLGRRLPVSAGAEHGGEPPRPAGSWRPPRIGSAAAPACTETCDWAGCFPGSGPTPHTPIYRDTLRYALAGERSRPAPRRCLFRSVLTAAPPRWLPLPVAVVLGMSAYSLERQMRQGHLHPSSGRRLGFRPRCTICAPANTPKRWSIWCSPPPPRRHSPRSAPAGTPAARRRIGGQCAGLRRRQVPGIARHLVLLTRPYPEASVGRKGNRWYLCPREPVPISRWEYTRPDLVEATIALGDRLAAA